MNDLKEFLIRRRQELMQALAPLVDQRAQIDVQINRLKKELSDIEQAAKSIGLQPPQPELQLVAEQRKRPAITIKKAVLDVLRDQPKGLIALDILARVNHRFDLGIVRTSLSPQLSRLKQEGKVTNLGEIWRLVPQKNEGSAK
jgi:hypothetical protein